MNRPNAANTSAHTQASSPHSIHAVAGSSAPDRGADGERDDHRDQRR